MIIASDIAPSVICSSCPAAARYCRAVSSWTVFLRSKSSAAAVAAAAEDGHIHAGRIEPDLDGVVAAIVNVPQAVRIFAAAALERPAAAFEAAAGWCCPSRAIKSTFAEMNSRMGTATSVGVAGGTCWPRYST